MCNVIFFAVIFYGWPPTANLRDVMFYQIWCKLAPSLWFGFQILDNVPQNKMSVYIASFSERRKEKQASDAFTRIAMHACTKFNNKAYRGPLPLHFLSLVK